MSILPVICTSINGNMSGAAWLQWRPRKSPYVNVEYPFDTYALSFIRYDTYIYIHIHIHIYIHRYLCYYVCLACLALFLSTYLFVYQLIIYLSDQYLYICLSESSLIWSILLYAMFFLSHLLNPLYAVYLIHRVYLIYPAYLAFLVYIVCLLYQSYSFYPLHLIYRIYLVILIVQTHAIYLVYLQYIPILFGRSGLSVQLV